MFTHNLNHVLFGETTAAGTATRQAITDNVGRVRAAVEEAFGQVIELLPSLVAMLVVLGVGFFVARLVARAVEALGDRPGINNGPGAFFHPHENAARGLARFAARLGIARFENVARNPISSPDNHAGGNA